MPSTHSSKTPIITSNNAQSDWRNRITVFYDGSCPLCRKEINHYRKLKPLQPICWIDISTDRLLLDTLSIKYDDAMRVLHVVDIHENIISGARAFIVIWQALPGYRYLAKLIKLFKITPVLEWGYQYFSRWRYRRRCHERCKI